jgi:hypothetical protein
MHEKEPAQLADRFPALNAPRRDCVESKYIPKRPFREGNIEISFIYSLLCFVVFTQKDRRSATIQPLTELGSDNCADAL